MVHDPSPRGALAVALIGADALLAARPATPVQVLHGCVDAGFVAAYPVTWGDELVARECLNSLSHTTASRVALCVCPFASRRVEEGDFPAERLALAAPPVAAARLVRAAYGDHPIRITFIGGCPSAIDSAIDAHVTPAAFLDTLRDRGIELTELPDAFEAVLPPDRRRFLSVPGGAPASELLALQGWTRVLEANGFEPATDRLLIDVAPVVGCHCAGGARGRAAVEELEPPRSQSPVVDPLIAVDMLPTPAFAPAAWRRTPPETKPLTDQEELIPSLAPALAPLEILSERIEEEYRTPPEELEVVPTTPLELEVVVAEEAPGEDVVMADDANDAGDSVEPDVVVGEATAQEPIRGEVLDGASHPGSGWSVAEPRVRRWTQSPQLVLPNDLPSTRRRGSGVAIGLALALGLTLPLALFGGWMLLRNGTGALRGSGRTPPPPAVASAPTRPSSADASTDSTSPREVGATMPPSIAARDTSKIVGQRFDSAAGQTEATGPSPRSVLLGARRPVPSAATRQATSRPAQLDASRRVANDRAQKAANATRQNPLPRVTADSAVSAASVTTRDSSLSERDALLRDIAIRRARAESLAKVVDSLNRVPTRPKKP